MSENFKNNPMTVEEFFSELIKGNDAPLKELNQIIDKHSAINYALPEKESKLLRERNYIVYDLVQKIQRINEAQKNPNGLPTHATVTTFKESGKYNTEDQWRIPEDAILPRDMMRSPDFQDVPPGWTLLVDTQYPWGFPDVIKKR